MFFFVFFLMSFTMMKPFFLCHSLATCQLLGSTVKQQDCIGCGKPTVLAWGGTLTKRTHQKSDCHPRVIPSFRWVFRPQKLHLTQVTFGLIPIPTPGEGNSSIGHGPISNCTIWIFPPFFSYFGQDNCQCSYPPRVF